MEYWHEMIVEKSWKILQELKNEFDFILIGGWAVYLWSKSQKSKDIDVIVSFEVINKIRRKYDLKKNDNLKKYEIKIEDIDIDIYVPFYSKLAISIDKVEATMIVGYKVIIPEALLILKQGAYKDRMYSEKGEKDLLDIMGLVLKIDLDFKKYEEILDKNKIPYFRIDLIKIIKNFKGNDYFSLTPRELRLKKEDLLKKLK